MAYVEIPDGSSSAHPVIKPGPRSLKNSSTRSETADLGSWSTADLLFGIAALRGYVRTGIMHPEQTMQLVGQSWVQFRDGPSGYIRERGNCFRTRPACRLPTPAGACSKLWE